MAKRDDYTLGLYEKALPNKLSIEDKLRYIKDIGFDALEISIDETDEKLKRLYDNTRKTLKEATDKTGISIRTMCLSGHRKYPLGSLNPGVRDKSLDIMKRAIEFSDYNGIKIIQLAGYDVYYEKSSIETEKFFLENLKKSVETAAKYGVILAFETMETSFMDTVEKAMHYVNIIDSPYLCIYPDIGNLQNAAVKYGHDIVSDLKKGKGHIVAAHLKETNPGIYRDMHIGHGGHTDYERTIKELKSQDVLMYTCEMRDHGEDNIREIVKDAYDFLTEKLDSN